MKTCPYCGKKYPDDATVCAIDGQSLSEPAAGRKKVSGIWRGVYGYGPHEKRPGRTPVAFFQKPSGIGSGTLFSE